MAKLREVGKMEGRALNGTRKSDQYTMSCVTDKKYRIRYIAPTLRNPKSIPERTSLEEKKGHKHF